MTGVAKSLATATLRRASVLVPATCQTVVPIAMAPLSQIMSTQQVSNSSVPARGSGTAVLPLNSPGMRETSCVRCLVSQGFQRPVQQCVQ